MDGAWFLLGLAAILVIVLWEIRNDGAAPDGPTSGLLAMPDEPARSAEPGKAVSPGQLPGRARRD